MTAEGQRGHVHHIELYVRDLAAAADFWGWLLEWLGYQPYQEWDEGISWELGPAYLVLVQAPETAEWLDRRHPGLNHLAFHSESREDVDKLTAAAREQGVRVLYEDRHPYAGGHEHYAVFLEGPDGTKVEVVAPGGQERHEPTGVMGTLGPDEPEPGLD